MIKHIFKYVPEHILDRDNFATTRELGMPYPAAHREQTKEKIIRSAQRLFNRRGFSSVSIDEVMSEAGLTRGSFYSYFKNKSDLYAQAVTQIVCDKREGVNGHRGPINAGGIVRDYLSAQHFEDVDGSCPMIGLPADISRTDAAIRKAFKSALRLMVEIFENDMTRGGQRGRKKALAVASLCVGGMVLARSVEDRALADELRDAALAAALSLGDW